LDSSRDEYNSREFWKFESAEDEEPDEDEEPPPKPEPPRPHHDDEKFKHIGDHTDKEFVKNFITGEECIHGGSGWWKYEFCYGKHVKQYHEDRFSKTVILLGEWNTKAHLLWIMRNHKKRPESLGLRRSLHHFYGNGDICDLTGLPRNVEVKLACVTGANNAHAMGIYLVEPKPCQYRLVVESPLLCSIINMADDDGLVKIPEH
jgi:endoplasmic reticulum lectin 1